MDELDKLAETGDWWSNPWWKNPDRQVFCPYPTKIIDDSAAILRRHFDAAWARESASNARRNFIFADLCIGGMRSAYNTIVNLGAMVSVLETSDGFDTKIKALKSEKQDSTYLEVEAAHVFAKAGHAVRFPREGDVRSPDVLAIFPDATLAIECKRLRSEIWEQWEDELTFRVLDAMPKIQGDQAIDVHVRLNPRLTEIRLSEDKEAHLNAVFLDAIVRQLEHLVCSAIAEHEPPFEIDIHELAHVQVTLREPKGGSSVTGVSRESPALFRRVFQNGVLRGCEQLPNEMPGIVIVYSAAPPGPAFFKCFFEAACKAQQDRFSKLVAVMVCSMQTIFQRSTPILYLNPYTSFERFGDRIKKILSDGFAAVPA